MAEVETAEVEAAAGIKGADVAKFRMGHDAHRVGERFELFGQLVAEQHIDAERLGHRGRPRRIGSQEPRDLIGLGEIGFDAALRLLALRRQAESPHEKDFLLVEESARDQGGDDELEAEPPAVGPESLLRAFDDVGDLAARGLCRAHDVEERGDFGRRVLRAAAILRCATFRRRKKPACSVSSIRNTPVASKNSSVAFRAAAPLIRFGDRRTAASAGVKGASCDIDRPGYWRGGWEAWHAAVSGSSAPRIQLRVDVTRAIAARWLTAARSPWSTPVSSIPNPGARRGAAFSPPTASSPG